MIHRPGAHWAFLLLALYGCGAEPGPPQQHHKINGTVRGIGGQPLKGAMITIEGALIGADAITVFTDKAGAYRTPALAPAGSAPGVLSMVARKPGFEAQSRTLDGNAERPVDFRLEPAENVASQVPASAWLAAMPDDAARYRTIQRCADCHQFPTQRIKAVSSSFDGLSLEERETGWRDVIRRMRIQLFGIVPDGFVHGDLPLEVMTDPATNVFSQEDEDVIAPFLARHMPTEFEQFRADDVRWTAPSGLSGTVIREYQMPAPKGMIHDMTLAPGPGGVTYAWGADWHKSELVRVHPTDGTQKWYRIPTEKGLPPAGPHTLVPDASGKLWMTLQSASRMARFDPMTEQWKLYGGFSPGANLHSFAVNSSFQAQLDAEGLLWITINTKNRVASLDPVSGEVNEYDLPLMDGETPFHAAVYGIVIESDRKHIWCSQLTGLLISFNTETRSVETVLSFPKGTAPRRPAIDDADVLWVPLFGAGQLLAYDTRTQRELGRYALPDRNAAPYTATWDRARRSVWVSGGNADVMYRFDTQTQEFTAYPLPRTDAIHRAIVIDRDSGDVWTAYANAQQTPGPDMLVMLQPAD